MFDGKDIPGKAATKVNRMSRREKALSYLKSDEGNCDPKEYQAALKAALTITPQLVHETIKMLRRRGYAYTVAPFEAGSQLAEMVCVDFSSTIIDTVRYSTHTLNHFVYLFYS